MYIRSRVRSFFCLCGIAATVLLTNLKCRNEGQHFFFFPYTFSQLIPIFVFSTFIRIYVYKFASYSYTTILHYDNEERDYVGV